MVIVYLPVLSLLVNDLVLNYLVNHLSFSMSLIVLLKIGMVLSMDLMAQGIGSYGSDVVTDADARSTLTVTLLQSTSLSHQNK